MHPSLQPYHNAIASAKAEFEPLERQWLAVSHFYGSHAQALHSLNNGGPTAPARRELWEDRCKAITAYYAAVDAYRAAKIAHLKSLPRRRPNLVLGHA